MVQPVEGQRVQQDTVAEVMEQTSKYDKYEPEKLPEWQRWSGEGDPPRKWWATDPETNERVLVYRSYADYAWD